MLEIAVRVQLHHLHCSFIHFLDCSFDKMVFLTFKVNQVSETRGPSDD